MNDVFEKKIGDNFLPSISIEKSGSEKPQSCLLKCQEDEEVDKAFYSELLHENQKVIQVFICYSRSHIAYPI